MMMIEKLPEKIREYINNNGSDLLDGYIRFLDEDEIKLISDIVEKSEMWNGGIPFATTVFGDVLAWEDHFIMLYKFSEEDYTVILSGDGFFFANLNDDYYVNEHFDLPIYKEVKQKLGAVDKKSVYTIEPIPRLGGAREPKYMSTGGIIEYLSLLIL